MEQKGIRHSLYETPQPEQLLFLILQCQVDWILDAASLKYTVFSKPRVRACWRRSLSGIKANDKNNLRYGREGGDELLPQELPDSSQELQEGPSPQPAEESRSLTQSITFFSN